MRNDKFRSVSDLRVQYMCEYRLQLKQIKGDESSGAAQRGRVLHEQAKNMRPDESGSFWIRIIILIIAAAAALLWIVG